MPMHAGNLDAEAEKKKPAGNRVQSEQRASLRFPNRRQSGTSLAEMAFMIPFFTIVLIGTLDMGRVFYAAIEVNNAAHAGAQYGSRMLTLANDTSGMQSAASSDAADISGISSTASYSCYCSTASTNPVSCAGGGASSCSGIPANVFVTVNSHVSIVPMFPWPGVPNPIVINASATMRAQ